MPVGIGYDSHLFAAGRKLILAGQEIPYHLGLAGHSDADVLTHAVIDAILGAAALGDIGQHFPDTDEAYRGVSSLLLLQQTRELLAAAGQQIVNVDVTVIIERPKLAPHIVSMRRSLAEVLHLPVERVSIKAKTNEGMGFVGRQEGVAVIAVAEVNAH